MTHTSEATAIRTAAPDEALTSYSPEGHRAKRAHSFDRRPLPFTPYLTVTYPYFFSLTLLSVTLLVKSPH